MKISIILLSFILILNLFATIINIPQDYSTIQEGINASVNADTVLVQPGTYIENINFIGKLITVASLFLTTQDTSYISHTIIDGIDGNQIDSVVRFVNGENSTSILTGFTITNGDVFEGGGISCFNNSNPSLENLLITGNYAYRGGGIWCDNSNPSLENVTITDNSTSDYSGGCGGIGCWNSSMSLKNVMITNNSAEAGGGIGCGLSSLSLDNVTITGNSSTYSGGGICSNSSNLNLENVTIANNSAGLRGGGIWCADPNTSVVNSILWSNSPEEIYIYSGSVTVTYTDIQGGWTGEGNIDADPLFVDAINGDYHLSENSPCIDAGDPSSPLDPDGTITDMGAFYFDQLNDIDENEIQIVENHLSNYPNPFNPETKISFSILNDSRVELSTYNIKGQKVKTLAHNEFNKGDHSIIWNGDDDNNKPVSSGVYLYKLNVNGKTEAVKKCLLLK